MKGYLKRGLAVFLSLSMMVSLLAVPAGALEVSDREEAKVIVTIGNGTISKVGETVDVPVTIEFVDENAKIDAFGLKFSFNSENFVMHTAQSGRDPVIKCDNTTLCTAVTGSPEEKKVAYADPSGYGICKNDVVYLESNIMFYLRFDAVEGYVNGDYTVDVDVIDNAEGNFAYHSQGVDVYFVPGTITLTGGIPVEDVTPRWKSRTASVSYTYPTEASEVMPLTSEATVTTEGVLSYQWYRNTENSNTGGSIIAGATDKRYTPTLPVCGTTDYYYCVATNTYKGNAYTYTFDPISVTYNKAEQGALTISSANTVIYGDTLNLTTEGGTGDGTVTYAVQNGTGEAAVEGSKLTPTKVGDVTVTATKAADAHYNEATATQTVTIQAADLTLNGSDTYDITAFTTKKPVTLTVPTAEAKNDQPVTPAWAVTEGEGKIALDTNGTVTVSATDSAKANDTATVTLTYSAPNHNNKVVTYNITILDKNDVSDEMTFAAKEGVSEPYDGTDKTVSTFVNPAAMPEGYSGTITYTVENSAGETVASGSDLNELKVTNAGTYTVTATYSDEENEGSQDLTFTIQKASVAKPTAKTDLTYNGEEQTGVNYKENAGYTVTGTTSATYVGSYSATATLDANHKWADNTEEPVTISWSIAQKPINVSAWTWSTPTSFTYNGASHSVTLVETNTDFDKVDVQYSDNEATNVGNSTSHTATATVTVKDKFARNYKIEGTVPACSWTLNPAEIDVSGVSFTAPDYTYNKGAQTVSLSNVPEHVSVSVKADTDAATQTEANNYYNTTFVLAPESTNYALTGRESYEINAEWTIKKVTVAVPSAITGLEYDGTEKTGVADPGTDALYTVSGNKQTNAGAAYEAIAALKDTNNYEWNLDSGNTSSDQTIFWSIAQADALTNLTGAQQMRYDSEGLTIDGDTFITGGNVSFTTANITVTGEAASILSVTAEDNDLKITPVSASKDDAGKTATITVEFTTPNYDGPNTMTITLNITSKTSVGDKITFAGGEVTYNGQAQKPANATISIEPVGTPTWTYVFKDSGGNEVTEMKNAGVYTVTATYEDDDNYGTTDPVNFTIKQAEVTITGGTVVAKTYDGTTTAEVTAPTVRGTVSGETLTPGTDFNISNASFENADAGSNKTVSYSVALADTDLAKNYTLTASTGSAKGTITPKSVAVTVDSIDAQTYTGIALKPAVTVTATGTINGYELVKDTDYTVSYSGNTSVGTATATVSTKTGSNYTFTAVNGDFTIDPAPLTISGVVIANKVYDATDAAAATAVVFTGLVNSETLTLGVDYTVTAAFADANAGEGKPVSYTVTLTDTAKANNYTLTGGVPGTTTADITKATPTGEPVYTKITSAGKTLADAKLEIGTLTPADGTLTWIDEDGNVMSSDTKVKANRAYTWKYTPDDTTNYNTVCGEIVLYVYRAVVPPAIGNAINVARVENGAVKLSTDNARPGRVVTITVSPADGYELESLLIYDTKDNLIQVTDHGDGTYSFVMPNCDVTVKVSFAKVTSDSAISFVDVPADSWYADAVAMMVNKGLFNGTSATTFSPDGNMTRAMLWTVLARMEGVDTTGGANWYEKGMNWAITEGISDGTNPGGNITREQLITMLWRYVGSPSASENSLRVFADVDDISSWATTAMAWATENGILNGINGNALPASNATRAQVAVILMRFVEKFAI